MALITIRVSHETREMLREIAAREQRPVSAIVHDAARAYRKELLWRRAEAGYARLAANEGHFREYQDEIAFWDTTSSDGLDRSDAYPIRLQEHEAGDPSRTMSRALQ